MTYQDATAQAETLKHYQQSHGLKPYVHQTHKRHGRGWRPTDQFGVAFCRSGDTPPTTIDGGFKMVPVESPKNPAENSQKKI